MAHPLNRARYAADDRRVVGGYGILQPRVAIGVQGAQRSEFARLHSGDAGIDPYTRAVSDVYQDVFGEGSFVGKGIYDVDAFEHVLKDRLPDNRILSHDLLEGCYARSGFASDIELLEDYPTSYLADVRRRHRWIRGDWQITRWLTPFVRTRDGSLVRNPLSALSRWKVLDNLRRSLMPGASVLLLILGWTVLPSPWFWTAVVIGVSFIPVLGASFFELAHKPDELTMDQHFRDCRESDRPSSFQHGVRTGVSAVRDGVQSRCDRPHRVPHAGQPQASCCNGRRRAPPIAQATTSLFNSYETMWAAPMLAIGTFVFLVGARPASARLRRAAARAVAHRARPSNRG